MPLGTASTPIEPYDIKKALAALEGPRQNITDFIATQQEQYDNLAGIITSSSNKAYSAIKDFRSQIDKFMASSTANIKEIDINSVVAPYRQAVNEQITNLQNSYQSQVAVQAKQLDAAVGAGAFSGNSYRARQAYQAASSKLFNESLGQIANVAIQSEQNIMSTVAGLETANLDARKAQATIQGQILGLYGDVAKLTIEAGATLTKNWLGLNALNAQTMLSAIQFLGSLSFKEADIQLQQARDVFGAEQQQLANNLKLQGVYVEAAAQQAAAAMDLWAAQDKARAQEAIAGINADVALQIADLQNQTQLTAEQNAQDYLKQQNNQPRVYDSQGNMY